MYDSNLGRWMEQDPAGYVDGMNAFESVRSNPVTLVDPLGLDAGALIIGPPAPPGWLKRVVNRICKFFGGPGPDFPPPVAPPINPPFGPLGPPQPPRPLPNVGTTHYQVEGAGQEYDHTICVPNHSVSSGIRG